MSQPRTCPYLVLRNNNQRQTSLESAFRFFDTAYYKNFALFYLKSVLDLEQLRGVFFALCKSHTGYGISGWGETSLLC